VRGQWVPGSVLLTAAVRMCFCCNKHVCCAAAEYQRARVRCYVCCVSYKRCLAGYCAVTMTDESLDILTNGSAKGVRIPNGPLALIVDAGDEMYQDAFESVGDVIERYQSTLLDIRVASYPRPTRFAVLSLEGRPPQHFLLRATNTTDTIRFYLQQDAVPDVPVRLYPPTPDDPVWQITRAVDENCGDQGNRDLYDDNSSTGCIFDSASGNLRYAVTTNSQEALENLWTRAQNSRDGADVEPRYSYALSGVSPPSVYARNQLEGAVETQQLWPNVTRTLVPWIDYQDENLPGITVLRSHVRKIVHFFCGLHPTDMAIIKCSAGQGRSGAALMIGYMCYNPQATTEAMLHWYDEVHQKPAEGKSMWQDHRFLQASVRDAVASDWFVAMRCKYGSKRVREDEAGESKQRRVEAPFVDMCAR
jgi:hypothetical protein